jgi:hypothetical protein
MIKSLKKVNDLSLLLSKNDALLISEAVGMLRDEEPFEGAVALLTSYYDRTENNLVRKSIEGFMNDIKDQSVTKEIITEIRKPLNQTTICMLVASCWQSGLNYSEYTKDFAGLFLSSEYLTALECFTVIEESVHQMTKKKRDEIITMIREYSSAIGSEKEKLASELISILR